MKMPWARALRIGAALTALAALDLGCGGSEPEPKTARHHHEDEEPEQQPEKSSMKMGAELGALDEAKTDAVFAALLPSLERCLHQGAEQVEFLGGGVNFFVKVDADGSVASAYFEESTLGDRETERCMLSAVRKKRWPKPVGGEVGYARKSFDFDPPNDVRPPEEWESNRVSDALDSLSKKIDSCKDGVRGKFGATMYVDTSGKVLAVGVTPPDESGDESVDCLVGVLKDAKMPSPGSWPAKVSFQL
jgi:hypothetical protein